jgi:hypothetical protein
MQLPKPRRQRYEPLSLEWNRYLWAARRVLQMRVKRKEGNGLWWCLPSNHIQNLYVNAGLDLTDPIVVTRFKAIPPFFSVRAPELAAFIESYPGWFERLRQSLIDFYSPRPYERKRAS